MNVPDDWDRWWSTCDRCGRRYHDSEGGCDRCQDELEDLRLRHPLSAAGFTDCEAIPPRGDRECENCGWPASKHQPF